MKKIPTKKKRVVLRSRGPFKLGEETTKTPITRIPRRYPKPTEKKKNAATKKKERLQSLEKEEIQKGSAAAGAENQELTKSGRVPGSILKNAKHELFCQLWASHEEFFGNGVRSYAQVYDLYLGDPAEYATAKSNAARLLTNAVVLERIEELMDILVNDAVVDKELGTVIKQNADFSSKVSAIREYNRVKGRITNKVKHSGSVATEVSDDQFGRIVEQASKQINKEKK